MGGAASVPIAGQTLPPQQYSPRKNLIPKLEESILVCVCIYIDNNY